LHSAWLFSTTVLLSDWSVSTVKSDPELRISATSFIDGFFDPSYWRVKQTLGNPGEWLGWSVGIRDFPRGLDFPHRGRGRCSAVRRGLATAAAWKNARVSNQLRFH
jgi:hypothetical protein